MLKPGAMRGLACLYIFIDLFLLGAVAAEPTPCKTLLISLALEKHHLRIGKGHEILSDLQAHLKLVEASQRFAFPMDLRAGSVKPTNFDNEWKKAELERQFHNVAILEWFYRNVKTDRLRFEVLHQLHTTLGSSCVYKMCIIDFSIFDVKTEDEYRAWKLNQEIRKSAWEGSVGAELEKIYTDQKLESDVEKYLRHFLFSTIQDRVKMPMYYSDSSLWGSLRAFVIAEDIERLRSLAAEATHPYMRHFFLRLAAQSQVGYRKQPNHFSGWPKFLFQKYLAERLPSKSPLLIDFNALREKYSADSLANALEILVQLNEHRTFLVDADFRLLVREAVTAERPQLAIQIANQFFPEIKGWHLRFLVNYSRKRILNAAKDTFLKNEILFFAEYAPLEEAEKLITSFRNAQSLDQMPVLLDDAILITQGRRDGTYEYRMRVQL